LAILTLVYLQTPPVVVSLPVRKAYYQEKVKADYDEVKIFQNTSAVAFMKFHKVSGDTLARMLISKFGKNHVPDVEKSPCHDYKQLGKFKFDPISHFTLFYYAFEGRHGLERCLVERERMVVISMLRDPFELTTMSQLKSTTMMTATTTATRMSLLVNISAIEK